eukprot:TRINITY_DN17670_c0_g1_i1.p1 TRINITY_DN17670_c0_g1~~TRINITY_DN17670_c0_g1_i1.p1  ORF type:complete len:245 (-),score=36.88 TRINITY_DN17670_c0_g1_i1:30-728(-)
MDVIFQTTLAVQCEFDGQCSHLELPLTNPDQQTQLPTFVYDADAGFSQELKPDNPAFVEMVETGIQGTAQLRESLRMSLSGTCTAESGRSHALCLSSQIGEDPAEGKYGITSKPTPFITEEDGEKEVQRCGDPEDREARSPAQRMNGSLEEIEKQGQGSESSEEEVWTPPVRSEGFMLITSVRPGGGAVDQNLSKDLRNFPSIMPRGRVVLDVFSSPSSHGGGSCALPDFLT